MSDEQLVVEWLFGIIPLIIAAVAGYVLYLLSTIPADILFAGILLSVSCIVVPIGIGRLVLWYLD